MGKHRSVVAIYPSHTAAEQAVKELLRASFDLKKLSIVGREDHSEEQVVGFYNGGDRMRVWGRAGAFWSGMWGLLSGAAFFWIPGLGPLFVAGPLVDSIIGVLEGTTVVGGLTVLGAGLSGLGIPKESVLRYEIQLRADKFLLIVHGSKEDTHHARQSMEQTHPESLDHHVDSSSDPTMGKGVPPCAPS